MLRLTPVMGKLNPRKPSLPSQEFACFWCTVLTLFRKRVSDLNCISKLQSRTQFLDRFELVQALTRQSRAGWLVLLWKGAFTLFPSRNLNNDPVEMNVARPGEFSVGCVPVSPVPSLVFQVPFFQGEEATCLCFSKQALEIVDFKLLLYIVPFLVCHFI